ncbi:fibronectin type III domain-containing protein [Flavobacterium microcysteis]
MKTKIKAFAGLLVFVLLMGCSGSDDGGNNCGKVESLSFNTTPTSAIISFISGNNATSFKIEHGPTGFTPGTGTSMFTSDTYIEVGGLTPSTTYDFYISGMCGAGQTSASKLFSVTTKASQCTGTTSVEIAQLYPNEIELFFTYSGTSQDHYEVEYGLAGFTLGTGTKVTTSPGNSSKTLTGIQASVVYDLYVRSYCISGEKTPYTKYTYTTINGCPKPTNLNSWNISGSCTAGTETRAFSWSYPSGTPQNYTFAIAQGATDHPENATTFTTSERSISLTNLNCNWRVFYVRANCTNTDKSEWAGPYYF